MKYCCLLLLFLLHWADTRGSCANAPAGQVIQWGMDTGGLPGGEWPPRWGVFKVSIGGEPLTNAVAVAAGGFHSLALLADGTVFGWGGNIAGAAVGYETESPHRGNGLVKVAGKVLSNVTALAAGRTHSLALKSDGTVVAWGLNQMGETDVPAGLSNVMMIAAGETYSMALKSDGTVSVWGNQARLPDGKVVSWGYPIHVPAGQSNAVAISAMNRRSLALTRAGTVYSWSQRSPDAGPVPGLTNIVAISAGGNQCLALDRSGKVFGWRAADLRDVVVSAALQNGQALNGVVAIAVGYDHNLALKGNGSVIAWGNNSWHQTDVPPGLSNVVAIAAGQHFSLAIQRVTP